MSQNRLRSGIGSVMPVRRHRSLDDAELLSETVRGEPEAFGEFYERFESAVLGYFYRATGRSDVAVDLTAETFAQALESARSYRPDLGSARAWLFGIAHHELANAFEHRRVQDAARRRLKLEALVLRDTALDEIEWLAISADGDALSLLSELPSDQREAIRGRVLDERGYPELAASLACSPSVVRQRVSRGLRNLRTRLDKTDEPAA